MVDRRVINMGYSKPAIHLVQALSAIMFNEGLWPGLPTLAKDGMTLAQNYAECPANSGCAVYYRVSEDGLNVLIFDPETTLIDDPYHGGDWWQWEDIAATHTVPIAGNLASGILAYLNGEF